MDRRDLLLVDNRGTGGSHVIDCEQIQTSAFLFLQGAAECGDLLGKTCDPVPCKRVYHDTFYINSAADDMRAGMAKLERLLLGSETLLADNEVATETLDPNLL
jgi:pimeloyl-ACP methyl ester carboxylesterase